MTSKNTLLQQLEWIGGKRSCLQILNTTPHSVQRIVITQSTQERLKITPPTSCKLSFATQDEISQIVEDCNHQGIAILTHPSYFTSFDHVLNSAQKCMTLLAIDSIQDPHNLGAICRCAAAFSVDAVLITKRSIPGGSHWKKVASGALAHVRLCPLTNMKDALTSLKTKGFWCIGLAEEGDDYTHNITEKKVVYVCGGEEKGIRPLVRRTCDALIRIPTSRAFSTLNMSHACAITLSQRFCAQKNDKIIKK